jgi:adenylylsulfate kinase
MTGVVVWITGLPSSGKSTLGRTLVAALGASGKPACILDGDVMRRILAPRLGYSDAERATFYEMLSTLAAELAAQGLVVLVAATAHRRVFREHARAIAPAFLEVFVNTPVEECERRDSKGLYAASAAGTERGVPGAGAKYEPPAHADVVASGGNDPKAVEDVLRRVAELGASGGAS